MTGRDIREALDKAGVLPSKTLGQNFLIDSNIARWIVDQLDLEPGDSVVEVGPGTGALSEHLVDRVKSLVLIEFDSRLAAYLKDHFAAHSNVTVHSADAARFDIRSLFKHRPVKFLGNLPYSAGGAIMRNFLNRPHPFSRAVLMLQKEVVDRLAAGPGTKDYGVLSLRTQIGWEVKSLRTVPPEAFHPRPRIDSSVAVLTPRDHRDTTFDGRLFDELIRRGFAQRRKQLKKQLPDGTDWPSLAAAMGLDHTVRGEELTLHQWIELTRRCDSHPLGDLPQCNEELFDVVDEADQIVGSATRAEVHSRDLIHRAVHAFVQNRHGDVLLQLRSTRKDKYPSKWDSSVSGHLDLGESYLAAVTREMGEEMGIHNATPIPIATIPPSRETGWEHIHLFTARFDGSPRFPASEIEAVQWFPATEIDAWLENAPEDFAPGFTSCWAIARSQMDPPGADGTSPATPTLRRSSP